VRGLWWPLAAFATRGRSEQAKRHEPRPPSRRATPQVASATRDDRGREAAAHVRRPGREAARMRPLERPDL
jgi:hypothetical protein